MNTHETAALPAPATSAALSGLVALCLALALAPVPAAARHFSPEDRSAGGDLVSVQVMVQGQTAPLYVRWEDRDRFYFQAFKGRNYSLRVQNRTGERVGVLIAVDGLNVVNGERSGLGSGEAMYVLGPWESSVIRGWRTSLSEIRQFVFVDEERSYAERTGQANGDMGWIRVLSFRENRPVLWNEREWPGRRLDSDEAPTPREEGLRKSGEVPRAARDNAAPPAPETRAKDQVSRQESEGFPGTGWGDRREDQARRVRFDPARNPTDRIAMRYEYASGLRALGIFPKGTNRLWEREHGQMGFAQPPRW